MRYSFKEVAKKETGDLCRALAATNATGSDAIKMYMQLAHAEMRALPKQRRLLERLMLQSKEERRAAASERRQLALRRREELLIKLRQFDEDGDAEDAQKILKDRRARRWAAVYGELALRREQLTHVLSCVTTAVHVANFTDAVDSWVSFESAVHRALASLDEAKHAEVPALATQPLYTQLEQVSKMQPRVTALLNHERHQQSLLRESTAELFRDQERLLSWCVEQQETLCTLKNLEEIQEFSASFMSNAAVMDTNFLVLLERSTHLVSNRAVREALVVVNRAWMELAIAVYDTMQHALKKEHADSGVEAGCRWWVDAFEPRLQRTLIEAGDIASHAEMQSEPLMQAIYARSVALLRDLASPRIIALHISNFTERMDSVAPHEEALREALLMRLSLLTQTLVGDFKYPGHREYADRLREVSDWVDAEAKGVVYTQLMRRVERLRSMVEAELRLLMEGKTAKMVQS
ncbi:hypothetical protein TraAM80_00361 [Trypanosoma rangeli]|uniref:Uncharacterized protein n=1 Tax=Trypanosoma rangeli TaxID=5698 RepID=A0A3R7LDN5_TRYRA|nr:uncharacterized protein TraAM80_00361 [Trypanosoma rangeli]RNF12350.1 hypothetical protein TraAM80_00361 [Trypanosoma rangeli]|eukprot:RNF12350.1 hypothetical protein TraAM80_00361 [Trypanosoma rangeli]